MFTTNFCETDVNWHWKLNFVDSSWLICKWTQLFDYNVCFLSKISVWLATLGSKTEGTLKHNEMLHRRQTERQTEQTELLTPSKISSDFRTWIYYYILWLRLGVGTSLTLIEIKKYAKNSPILSVFLRNRIHTYWTPFLTFDYLGFFFIINMSS